MNMDNENQEQKHLMAAYKKWPEEPHKRWIHAGNTFGIHLIEHVRENAIKDIKPDISSECREVAEQAIDSTLWHMMALLDGIFPNRIDEAHKVDYSLLAHIRDENDLVVETFELAPDGDGLSMGYAGWRDGDFGQDK